MNTSISRELAAARGYLDIRRAHPTSQACFKAFNQNMAPGDLPHPVRARNIGLLRAWCAWVTWLGGKWATLPDVFANPIAQTITCFEFIHESVQADPAWHPPTVPAAPGDEMPTFILFSAAPILYWSRPRLLIEPLPALQQMLTHADLGSDLPANLLRPPQSACYIQLGEEMRQAIIPAPDASHQVEGIYVLEAGNTGQRALSFVTISRISTEGGSRTGVGSIEIIIRNEQEPIIEIIHKVVGNSADAAQAIAHNQSIVQLCAKVFLYYNLPEARRIEKQDYTEAIARIERLGPKKAAKLRRQVDKLYDHILLGPSEALAQDRGETAPHWRRGHFRMQPHGPKNSLRKVMFIAPVLVRADRLASAEGEKAARSNHTSG